MIDLAEWLPFPRIPFFHTPPGCYGGCGGWGWRKLRGTTNATEAQQEQQPAGSNQTVMARPGEERRPPNANATSEQPQAVPVNQTQQQEEEAAKDGWYDEHGHWHDNGWHRGWDNHHGGWDHHGAFLDQK